jgi:hypothetical protein
MRASNAQAADVPLNAGVGACNHNLLYKTQQEFLKCLMRADTSRSGFHIVALKYFLTELPGQENFTQK